jgi:hypothetical protein
MEFGGVDLLDSDRKTYNTKRPRWSLIFTPKKLTGPIKPKLSGRMNIFLALKPTGCIEKMANPDIKIIS